MSEQIKPCPNPDCSAVLATKVGVVAAPDCRFVRCNGCYMQGPIAWQTADAIARWNRVAQAVEDAERYRKALELARQHVLELEGAWRDGVLDERDGRGGERSNRNVQVRNAIIEALKESDNEAL